MLPLIGQTNRHISDCRRRIDEQRRRIFEQRARGDDTTASSNLLATMIHFHTLAELRRETLLRLSARQGAGTPLSD